jgi:hypothetical protein
MRAEARGGNECQSQCDYTGGKWNTRWITIECEAQCPRGCKIKYQP